MTDNNADATIPARRRPGRPVGFRPVRRPGEKFGRPNLLEKGIITKEIIREIQQLFNIGVPKLKIKRQYNISMSTVNRILSGFYSQ